MNDHNGLICTAVGVKTLAEAIRLVEEEQGQTDVIEIRLDSLEKPAVIPFFKHADIPLLFTNRPTWEGGYFEGLESVRIALLEEAVEHGAAYIDCELRAPEESRNRLMEKTATCQTKLILSWHDFKTTPDKSFLRDLVISMQKCSADIGKIVTTAHTFPDVLRVLALQEIAAQQYFPLIAFCMGKAGMISRLATLKLGGYMSYCAPRKSGGTATGQLGSVELRTMLERFK
ncbi:MAG: type I 3-dehydroquinate dehydratase [Desulfocapsaceae bacterium]|nr:type I 3-dehydroquinate dehydratase [Desulfocapsaceae bacterium]